MKIVSVMTTTAEGGAEFAAMEMLWALEQRGHETAMLTDLPAIGRETGVSLRAVELGPKLSGRDWLRVNRGGDPHSGVLEREQRVKQLKVELARSEDNTREMESQLAACRTGLATAEKERGAVSADSGW